MGEMLGGMKRLRMDAEEKVAEMKKIGEEIELQRKSEGLVEMIEDMLSISNDIGLYLSNPLLFASSFHGSGRSQAPSGAAAPNPRSVLPPAKAIPSRSPAPGALNNNMLISLI